MSSTKRLVTALLLSLFCLPALSVPLGTAFIYQGNLQQSGVAANGLFDIQASLWDAVTNGTQKGTTQTFTAVAVTNGLFTLSPDFGAGVFDGTARWLELDVRTNGIGSYVALNPRQPVTATPYALEALNSLNATVATSFTGAVQDGQLSTNVALLNHGDVFSGNVGVGPTATNPVAPLTVSGRPTGSAVGSVTTSNTPAGVAVAGSFAYVAMTNGLQVFDVSNPGAPVSLGSLGLGGQQSSVAVAGRFAYLSGPTNSIFSIVDVSTPGAPALAETISTGGNPNSVTIAGRYAYVANSTGNLLQVIDVGNSTNASIVGAVTTANGPSGTAISGRYAYVVNTQSNSLQVIDVNVPSAPIVTGTVPSTGAVAVAVSGKFAFAVTTNSVLQVFDVSNPSAPTAVGSVGTGNLPVALTVAGRNAWVLNSGDGTLQTFDVGNPATPVSLGTISAGAGASGLAVAGRYAYVVNRTAATLQVFDLGGAYIQQLEAGSTMLGTLQTRGPAVVGQNLDVRGGFTASGSARISGGVQVDGALRAGALQGDAFGLTNLNGTNLTGVVSDSRLSSNVVLLSKTSVFTNGVGIGALATNVIAPLTVSARVPTNATGTVGTINTPLAVAVSGSFAYVGAASALQIVDLTVPSAPTVLGSVTLGSQVASVAAAGRYVYAVYGGTLGIVDVSNPASPALVGSVVAGTGTSYVAVAGRYAYVTIANFDTMQIVDVSNPAQPVLLGTKLISGEADAVAVAGKYLYVVSTAGNAIFVLDVSNPASPTLVGSVGVTGPSAISVVGRYAYVAASGGLQIIDVGNPGGPAIAGSVAAGSSPDAIAVTGRNAAVLNLGDNTLQLFDVSNPTSPPRRARRPWRWRGVTRWWSIAFRSTCRYSTWAALISSSLRPGRP